MYPSATIQSCRMIKKPDVKPYNDKRKKLVKKNFYRGTHIYLRCG